MAEVTAAQLYDYIACPHRVALDSFGAITEREEVSPFVRLLWERGSAFERQVAEADTSSRISVLTKSMFHVLHVGRED